MPQSDPPTDPLASAALAGAPPRQRGRGAERLRWGLTGLAAIFLLVLIAAAGLRPAAPARPQPPAGEPLAVLGVAPGAAQPAPESPPQPK